MQNIFISTPGTLKEQLDETEWRRLKGLKLKGKINDSDIEWIDNLTAINKGIYIIDLFECTLPENHKHYIFFERGLGNLNIPEGLETLERNSLKCLSINTLSLPKSLRKIEKGALNGCHELKIINVNEQNPSYKSVNGLLYTKEGKEFLFCPPKREGEIQIKEGTQKIASRAFAGCERLNTVVLPRSIDKERTGTLIHDFTNKKTEIRWNIDHDKYNVGDTNYTEGGKVLEKHLSETEDYKEGDPHYDLLKKGEYDFCVPSGVEEIASSAFTNSFQLRSIKLPNSLQRIGEKAFENCTHLTAIEMPNKLKEVGNDCFNACRNLGKICCWAQTPPKCKGPVIDNSQDKMLYVPKGTIDKYKKAKGWKLFKNIREVDSFTSVVYRLGNGEKNTITYSPTIVKTELKAYLCDIWQNVSKISISGKINDNDIDFLREMCIKGQLSEIDLGETQTTGLKYKSFADAERLSSIILPDSITIIPNSLFIGCKRLKKVVIGTNTATIEDFAFADCCSLKHIDLSGSISHIGRGAYWNCQLLDTINLGDNELTISEDAFRNCVSLRRINCHYHIPPHCKEDSFSSYCYQNVELTVPLNGYATYQQDKIWSSFTKVTAENILF